jgi:hypothetical protein
LDLHHFSVTKLPADIARELAAEEERRKEALRALYEDEQRKKAKTDSKKHV